MNQRQGRTDAANVADPVPAVPAYVTPGGTTYEDS